MPAPLMIDLTEEQRAELEDVRDNHEKRYMRERALAILKIAGGLSVRQVALNGLPQRRDPDTVYSWFHRYEAEGLKGLHIRPGRGRKPSQPQSSTE